MGGGNVPIPIGTEPGPQQEDVSPRSPGAGFEFPGPIGADAGPIVKANSSGLATMHRAGVATNQ